MKLYFITFIKKIITTIRIRSFAIICQDLCFHLRCLAIIVVPAIHRPRPRYSKVLDVPSCVAAICISIKMNINTDCVHH